MKKNSLQRKLLSAATARQKQITQNSRRFPAHKKRVKKLLKKNISLLDGILHGFECPLTWSCFFFRTSLSGPHLEGFDLGLATSPQRKLGEAAAMWSGFFQCLQKRLLNKDAKKSSTSKKANITLTRALLLPKASLAVFPLAYIEPPAKAPSRLIPATPDSVRLPPRHWLFPINFQARWPTFFCIFLRWELTYGAKKGQRIP